ncbi:MAG: hypothetical protein Q8L57_01875, partial [bacterium]|nr:hypothetical protein [bacterium]
MNKIRLFWTILACFSLLSATGCKEKPFWIENYGSTSLTTGGGRQVICVETPEGQPGSLIKFELGDGKNLSAVYWQRNTAFGYLYDFRSDKLFIDVSSGIFFRKPADFYESLERDIDIQKIKNVLTREIIEEFCRAIEQVSLDDRFAADLEKIKIRLRRIDLNPWYRAVEAEQDKIHALGIEYCVSKTQAEELFKRIDFNADYRQILGHFLENRRQGLIGIGENHPEDADRLEVTLLLEEAKIFKANYFFIEWVLAADQKILDNYRPDDEAAERALLD